MRTLLTSILLAGFCLSVIGQNELGIIAGISNYQGDLTSFSKENGFKALIGPVLGLHAGYEITPHFQARADLLYTRLSGDDDLSDNPSTQSRNLDFFAPVIQLAVGIDWNVFGFSTEQQRTYTPYGSVGFSMFYFNPKTFYQGKRVALQPLGTEGQYLADYPDQKPYSRFQPTLQFGGGLKLMTSQNIVLAIESMLSYTFTDYLDDVSTIYISYPELLEKAGPLTAALANRQGEFSGTEPVVVETGTLRANSKSKDYFGTITIRASVPMEWGAGGVRIRPHQKKRIHCPKF